ncbi:desmoplakin-like, partial [Leptonychotes weddellii]|uniref:Desmoplakin-like n=1 Tax=Leptonychotes weddellii TaxID=9713 RepID=A0A2U3Z7L3_LEPWE
MSCSGGSHPRLNTLGRMTRAESGPDLRYEWPEPNLQRLITSPTIFLASLALYSLCTVRALLQAILQTEDMLKVYEARLTEEETVSLDLDKVEAYRCGLKKIKNDLNLKKSFLATMKTELQKAQQTHSQTSQQYPLYDLDLGKFSDKVTQLTDRWQKIDKQIDY